MFYEGKYYRQGEQMRYQPEEEIVHNDQYSKSLYELLVNNPKAGSILDIQHIINNNGYYGRALVYKIYENQAPTNNIRILVELIWSGMKYRWPHEGVYNLNTRKIIRTKPKDDVDFLDDVVEGARLCYNNMCAAPNLLTMYSGMNRNRAQDVIERLEELRLVRANNFWVVDDLELEESIANLIKQNTR